MVIFFPFSGYCQENSKQKPIGITVNAKLASVRKTKEIMFVTTPLMLKTDFASYSGIKYTKDSLFIGKIVLNREQFWYDQSKLKDSLFSYYVNKIIDSGIDTLMLSKTPLKTYVSVLVKILNDKKIIIVDSNNNFDFSDETIIEYAPLLDKFFYQNYENNVAYKVKFEKLIDGKILEIHEDIKIKPFDEAYNYKNKIDSITSIYFTPVNYLKGSLRIEHTDLDININKIKRIGFNENPLDYVYSLTNENSKIRSFDWIKFNQNIKINNNIIQIVDFSEKTLMVTLFIRKALETDFGWNLGDYIPDVILTKYYSNEYKQKKINILNFWGSWCGPCLQEISELKKLSVNNKQIINLANFACEYDEIGIEKAKNIVLEKELNWPQFYGLINQKENINSLLNVITFPTIIVFDNTGKILAREIGLGNIESIKEQFKLD